MLQLRSSHATTKRFWCLEGLRAGGEGDDRGWDGWMASLTPWTGVWVNSRSWWWTGRPGVLQFMGLQRVGHNWATEVNWLNWTAQANVTDEHRLKHSNKILAKRIQQHITKLIRHDLFSSVQSLSCPILCDPMDCSTPGLPVHHQLREFTQTHVHWVDDAIQPSHPLPSPSLPAFNVSRHQGLYQWVRSLNQVAKVLEFQLQHQSFQLTFRTDFLWDGLVRSPCSLKSLLQHHSSEASILWQSTFFIVQLSHPYMTTGKTIALTRWTFVGKVMPLLINMLSRFVINFLPRSKCRLISWLQSASAVILEP